MGSSLNGTGLTFSSGATLNALPVTSFAGQTGAVDPTTIGNIGNIVLGINRVSQTVGINPSVSYTTYTTGTTISGSNLAYDVAVNGRVSTAFGVPIYAAKQAYSSATVAFPNSGATLTGWTYSNNSGGTATSFTYSTLSGSWRSLNRFTNTGFTANGCPPNIDVYWSQALWVRYA